MFRIDSINVVDATTSGNAARFINHSCEVSPLSWFVFAYVCFVCVCVYLHCLYVCLFVFLPMFVCVLVFVCCLYCTVFSPFY